MGKSIKVIDKDKNGQTICNSLHLDEIYSSFAKTSRIENISYEQALTHKWGNAGECLLIAHSFKAWDFDVWNDFLNKTKAQIFVLPTEILHNDIMKETFTHPNISKIIINNESNEYRKLFKSYGIENQKIKYISIPSSLGARETKKRVSDKKIIICPGFLSHEKNYNSLLIAAEKITQKHLNAVFVLLLKSPKDFSEKETTNIVNKIYQTSMKLRLKNTNFVILLDKDIPYESYLQQADIIVSQKKSPIHMYDGTIIDGISLMKPVVAAYSVCAVDFASKQDLGVHIYDTKDEKGNPLTDEQIASSIFQNCSIIIENSSIEEIMSKQNSNFVHQTEVHHVVQQYFNLVKRSKNG